MKKKFINSIVQAAKEEWPPTFALAAVDKLSGGACNNRTIRNKRSLGLIPENCFFKHGRKVIVHRDRFLAWWDSQIRSSEIEP